MDEIIPIDEEFIFDTSSIISQTDLEGVITYANRKFCEISGYSINELLGQPHNIVKHPDMPPVVFEKMWHSISTGHDWNGLVKNLRKDGYYYWVDMEVLPIHNKNNELTGYISVRKAASRKNIEETEITYKEMHKSQEEG